jgi:hypothetical protein
MAKSGAGVIGDYTSCSFRLKGSGTFKGNEEARPFVGKAQQLETVEEVRLEMLAPRAILGEVISSMKAAHPYEEVAYDVYALENSDPNFGMGAIGELPRAASLRSLLARTKSVLGAECVRYAGDPDRRVRRVAVCGGSGSDLVKEAIGAGADVFITSDVRYHTYHDVRDRIALVDAGHWETEHVVLPTIQARLSDFIRRTGASAEVFVSRTSTNPIHCY